MNSPILIIGATGNVGSELVRLLHNAGHTVRAAVVSDADAAQLPDGVTWVHFDFTNPETFADAFANVKKMFLMRPPQISNVKRDMRPAIDYAAAVGMQHIVFLSLLGAERNRIVPHAKVEALLQAGSVPYTLLRCGFFMQNLSTTHRQEIQNNDEIFIPAGKGKTAFVDVRDIAAVAARVLTEPGNAQQAYQLTGAEALNYNEVAALMTQTWGRPIQNNNPHFLRFAWQLWRRGKPLRYVAGVSA
ncbi:MAG: NAD-dependent epimerase/dehydratase family protein, partial [Chloroflexi bacterium]